MFYPKHCNNRNTAAPDIFRFAVEESGLLKGKRKFCFGELGTRVQVNKMLFYKGVFSQTAVI